MSGTNQFSTDTDSTTHNSFQMVDPQLSIDIQDTASVMHLSEHETETGGKWQLSGAFTTKLNEDPEFEETFISSIRRIERWLSKQGYLNPAFKGEVEYYQEQNISPDYRLRVTVDVSTAEEWIEIEDQLQEIVVESEVGDAELYVVVDRVRS